MTGTRLLDLLDADADSGFMLARVIVAIRWWCRRATASSMPRSIRYLMNSR